MIKCSANRRSYLQAKVSSRNAKINIKCLGSKTDPKRTISPFQLMRCSVLDKSWRKTFRIPSFVRRPTYLPTYPGRASQTKQTLNQVLLPKKTFLPLWLWPENSIFIKNFWSTLRHAQCDQIGRFIGLCATFQSLWQQLICPNLLHS